MAGLTCTQRCGAIGAIGGVVLLILLMLGGLGFFGALIWGLLAGGALGFIVYWFTCRGAEGTARPAAAATSDSARIGASADPAPGAMTPAGAAAIAAAPASADEEPARPATGDPRATAEPDATAESLPEGRPADPEGPTTTDSAGPGPQQDSTDRSAGYGAVRPSTHLKGQAELEEGRGDWKYTPGGGAESQPSVDEESEAPTPPDSLVSDDDRPILLDEARDGQPDDLKLIRGVGPKLESMLHRLGVFHFDQIGSWSEREIAWVDTHLEGFRGRVHRDDWVAQAKVLAAGGDTDFSRNAAGD